MEEGARRRRHVGFVQYSVTKSRYPCCCDSGDVLSTGNQQAGTNTTLTFTARSPQGRRAFFWRKSGHRTATANRPIRFDAGLTAAAYNRAATHGFVSHARAPGIHDPD